MEPPQKASAGPARPDEEADWIRQAAAGDRAAFGRLVLRHQDAVITAARYLVRDPEDAEDVAQEAMARAYRNFARLHDRGRFQPWLVRIAWRLAVNRRRGDGRRAGRERALAPGPERADAEALVLSREFEEHLWRAVDGLPERLRAVVLLCAAQGYEVREVAAALAVPEGTVKSRLHRARRVLAEKLQCLMRGVDRS